MTSERDPLFLSVAEVLALHDHQLRLYGGSVGIRDAGALESAVATPAATFDQAFLHEDVFHMAAAYAFHIAENQPFVDGNKRACSGNLQFRRRAPKRSEGAERSAAQLQLAGW